MNEIGHVVRLCFDVLENNTDLQRATYYCSPKMTVKVTRQHRVDRRKKSETFIVTVGRPNYRERKYIESKKKFFTFPMGPIRTYWPVKRRAA